MQSMISAAFLFLLSGSITSDDPLGKELIRAVTNMGAYHQLAKECGAEDQALAKMEASNLADIAEMKEKSANLGIDFDLVYSNGKNTGHEKFTSLGDYARNTPECSQAILIVKMMQ